MRAGVATSMATHAAGTDLALNVALSVVTGGPREAPDTAAWELAAHIAPVSKSLRAIVNDWRATVSKLNLCSRLTDAEMWLLSARCRKLRTLRLVPPAVFDDEERAVYTLSSFAMTTLGLGCRGLTSLELPYHMRMTESDLGLFLGELSSLRRLKISHYEDEVPELMDGSFLRVLGRSCPMLEELDLFREGVCPGIGNNSAAFAALSIGCPHLRVLYAEYSDVTSASLCALVRNSQQQIRELHLSHAHLDDTAVFAVATHCSNLELLDISCAVLRSGRVSDATITSLARHCPQLRKLDLFSACDSITDDSVLELTNHCRRLEHLCLAHAVNLTDVTARAILDRLSALIYADVWACAGFSERYREAFATRFARGSRWVRR